MTKDGEKMKNVTAKQAEFIFGQPMNPCPKCGSYNLSYRTPIVLDVTDDDSPKAILGKYAKALRQGPVLEGPVYMICSDCLHRGPAIDCSHMTYDEMKKSKDVAKKVKAAWNCQ